MVSMSFQNGLWYCNDGHVKCTYVQSLHWIDIKWNPMYIEVCTCIGYSTIETKEAARIGYSGFLIPHEYSGEGRGA